MDFLDKFNKVTREQYNYMHVRSVGVKQSPPTVCVDFLVPYDILDRILTDEDKQRIYDAVVSILPHSINVEVTYTKSFVNEEIAKRLVIDYFREKHPTIIIDDEEVKVSMENDIVHVEIYLKSLFYDFFRSQEVIDKIIEYMSHKFCNSMTVELIDSKRDLNIDTDFAEEQSITLVARRVRTNNHVKVAGRGDVDGRARYIIDRPDTEEKAVYCGEVVDFKRLTSKKTGNSYYIISICDGTGTLVCKAFTKYQGEGEYDKIAIGDEIIVSGRIEIDTFQHDSVLLVQSVAKCEIDKSSIILKEELNGTPNTYTTVFPEPYVADMVVEADLFSQNVQICPQELLNKTFVVFDVETTGLSPINDEVIELAGVKLENGVITESFQTFVNPLRHIDDDIVELTNITDELVKDAPTMDKVLPDFYKFTRGAILVAHNAPFDKSFIDRYGKAYRYLFDNKVIDTLVMARNTVPLPKYKLEYLCKQMGINLEGAHRAINDCEATAKVFIELVRMGGMNK